MLQKMKIMFLKFCKLAKNENDVFRGLLACKKMK
eukprot:UN15602